MKEEILEKIKEFGFSSMRNFCLSHDLDISNFSKSIKNDKYSLKECNALKTIGININPLKQQNNTVSNRLNSFSEKLDNMEINFNKRFDDIELKFEKRFDNIETRLDKIETKINVIETRLDTVETKIDKIETNIDRLQHNFEIHHKGIIWIRDTLKNHLSN